MFLSGIGRRFERPQRGTLRAPGWQMSRGARARPDARRRDRRGDASERRPLLPGDRNPVEIERVGHVDLGVRADATVSNAQRRRPEALSGGAPRQTRKE